MRPLHTRFRWTPTGDIHLGHTILSWLSYHAARVTGGTFSLRCELSKATQCPSRWESFEKWWKPNLDDLLSFGLVPSDDHVFTHHGLDPSMRIQVSDDRGLCDYYYRELGFEKQYGPWPSRMESPTNNNWKSFIFGNYEQGWIHPYILLTMVVGDVVTGRNCIIRGDDLRYEAVAVNMMSHLVAKKHFGLSEWDHINQYVPAQYYTPKIKRSGTMLPPELRAPGGVTLSSSDANTTEGFYLRNVRDAGVSPERLWDFLGKILFGSVDAARCVYTGWGEVILRGNDPTEADKGAHVEQAAVSSILSRIVKTPLIEDEEWFHFLKMGRV